MFLKKFKNASLKIIMSTLLIMPNYVFAYSEKVIPGGENIGIQINTKGVIIVGLYKVNNSYPGKEANLKVGDIITKINDNSINNISEMISKIEESNNKNKIKITYLRNKETFNTNLKLVKQNDGIYRTGLYVKDSINGIGTLTFIDPATNNFGALGHEIIESNTGKKLEIKDGKIYRSEITSIDKSSNGNPGEKNAKYYPETIFGNINENTMSGIFGTYTDKLPSKEAIKVAKAKEIKLGNAKIRTVLEDEKVEEFDISITKIDYDITNSKNILFEIIDSKLLDKTGGVVQGMSGSPIIQDNMLIGAVTHVIIDDTTKGYGIFITTMLEEAEN
ncbi:MAG: SpoIVB peptidase [Firmicutes bacterium]|nr:SpoIVB peptidase [Bacillota bacterium]